MVSLWNGFGFQIDNQQESSHTTCHWYTIGVNIHTCILGIAKVPIVQHVALYQVPKSAEDIG